MERVITELLHPQEMSGHGPAILVSLTQTHWRGWTNKLVLLAALLSGHHPPYLFLSTQAVVAGGAWSMGGWKWFPEDLQLLFPLCFDLAAELQGQDAIVRISLHKDRV